MNIGVNAMQVRAAKSGVGQYIHALYDAATRVSPQDQFLIYCSQQNQPNYEYDTPNSATRVWGKSNARRPVRLAYEYAFLPGEISAQNFDVFHGASNFLPPRRVCPYVATIHDLSYYVHPERCPFVRRQYWYAMTRRTVQVADIILTVSQNSQRDIAHYFPHAAHKVRVVASAAHQRFQVLSGTRQQSLINDLDPALTQRPYILYLGTLEPGKNVTRIVQAFDAVAAQCPDHILVLAGDKGWLYESIFQAIETARHKDRIFYLGHVTDDQAVHLFNYADVFVFPSLYEGFGLPPLEAMACGCPVITSATSSIPEVVGDAAIKIDPQSVEQLTAAMQQVLTSPARRQEMREAGLARAAGFSWERTARETLDLFREAAAQG